MGNKRKQILLRESVRLAGLLAICVAITIASFILIYLSIWGFKGSTVYAKIFAAALGVIILVVTDIVAFRWFHLAERWKSLREHIYMQNGEINQDVVKAYRMLKSKYPLAVASYESQYFHDTIYHSSYDLAIYIVNLSEEELAAREQQEWGKLKGCNEN